MIIEFKESHSEKEIVNKFIELIRLNKHVKLNKSNPLLTYNVREFIKTSNIHPKKLTKVFGSKCIMDKLKEEFPIEVIEHPQFIDFHWVDNHVITN
ncbi:hypothetical protein BKP37_08410 [Anaerobacillus alkalilacustris]|uniref:Uncharacterized protein n=1 Tax=Anaerobacillus alkalilacustris TaxID=393763 RepID=A0A1S2LQ69_9BACI|nr:hypothetical protein [Anaerobacillus alkalilacustris]OIJ14360.1 hypothetical protein BKP37_08410 [Anaerobacillus alkalilacustris]